MLVDIILLTILLVFLDTSLHLYERVCLSVHLAVRLFGRPAVVPERLLIFHRKQLPLTQNNNET